MAGKRATDFMDNGGPIENMEPHREQRGHGVEVKDPSLNGDLIAEREERSSAGKRPGRGAVDQTTAISLPRLDIKILKLKIVGDSPLVSHAWSEKAMKEMLDKQMKKAKQAKQAKDPFLDFCDSMYWISERPEKVTQAQIDAGKFKFGIPAISFKKAAVDACTFVDGVTKVESRGAFHVQGELCEIVGPPPKMRRDMVRIAMGTSDIRFRGEFFPWSVNLSIRYNSAAVSAEQIVNLLNVAGFGIGVGENRPQRNGQWGLFHVATESE